MLNLNAMEFVNNINPVLVTAIQLLTKPGRSAETKERNDSKLVKQINQTSQYYHPLKSPNPHKGLHFPSVGFQKCRHSLHS